MFAIVAEGDGINRKESKAKDTQAPIARQVIPLLWDILSMPVFWYKADLQNWQNWLDWVAR